MSKRIKAVGLVVAGLMLIGITLSLVISDGVTSPSDTCTPGQTTDGCAGPADDGPPPHMDDQDDDGTDGTATPPPD